MATHPLPPATEAAYRILAERGPQPAAGLRDILRSQGFIQSFEKLARLPDHFPRHFQLTADGLLSVASAQVTDTVDEGTKPRSTDETGFVGVLKR